MPKLRPLILTLALAVPAGLAAEAPVIVDQSDPRTEFISLLGITGQVVAIDFDLTQTTRLTAATFWLADYDGSDDGTLGGFAGLLGWAVYNDSAGEPGTLVKSGRGIGLVQEDTGVQHGNGDVVRVELQLEPPLRLGPGTYWFALREGAWGTGSDGSSLLWVRTVVSHGGPSFKSSDVITPGSWVESDWDLACVLYGDAAAWDQGGVIDGANGHRITADVRANDFVVATPKSASAFDVWLGDDNFNDNGVVDDFGGTLGWAIYQNGSNVPGAMVASGEDSSPLLVDTLLQDVAGSDIVRARVRFGRSIALPAGTYWLALHEGDWGSASDGTNVYWVFATANLGLGTLGSSDEQNPVDWNIAGSTDTAFVLFDELVFASGFEAGTGCAWSVGPCP